MTPAAPAAAPRAQALPTRLNLAICSWEIGRAQSGLGVKIGGLGHVLEELPGELIRAAARAGLEGQRQEVRFRALAAQHPGQVRFDDSFNPVLAKLVTAGSDFALVPSRFEPCGLTEWEAALVGTLPICRATGGLTKIRHCGWLYDWLDLGDWWGEVDAFFAVIREALGVFRTEPHEHLRRMRAGLRTDTSWDASALRYVELYLAALAPPSAERASA